MGYSAPASRYLETEVLSRPKEWLVPLLYEHCVASLRRAGVRMEAGDIGGSTIEVQRAVAIISELLGSLDHAQGGRIAADLDGIYRFMLTELLDIQRKRDRRRLGRVTAMVERLLEAWQQAAEQVAPRNAARPALSVAR